MITKPVIISDGGYFKYVRCCQSANLGLFFFEAQQKCFQNYHKTLAFYDNMKWYLNYIPFIPLGSVGPQQVVSNVLDHQRDVSLCSIADEVWTVRL